MIDEAQYNAYKNKALTSRQDFVIHEQLDAIDTLRSENPDLALETLEKLLAEHPNSPRGLHTLIRTYRILYNRLSIENKKIGRIEYLDKMLETVMKFAKLDRSSVPLALWTSVIDYGLANSVAMGERGVTLRILKEIVTKLEGVEEEDKEYYIQSYIDELFFSGNYEKCREAIVENSLPDQLPNIQFRFLMAMLVRLEEKKKNQPFFSWDESMIEQTSPQNQMEKDEVFVYAEDLAKELRRSEQIDLLNMMYDLMVDLGLYPSRYQRIHHHMKDLLPKPIWEVSETGYEDKLKEIESSWETIRAEALELIRLTPEQNVTYGREAAANVKENWKHYYIHGLDQESFPDRICDITPTLCKLLKDYPPITMCPLGSIKISYIAPDTIIQPHTSNLNFRLRAQLPLFVPPLNETETSDMSKMVMNGGQHEIKWEEGKMVVFDDSFEHEVINETNQPRVLLIFDMVHPDMTEPMFKELTDWVEDLQVQQEAMAAQAQMESQ
jgi:aspartyl/asparaginyl beta-hydroxylase (cupin superfamily)